MCTSSLVHGSGCAAGLGPYAGLADAHECLTVPAQPHPIHALVGTPAGQCRRALKLKVGVSFVGAETGHHPRPCPRQPPGSCARRTHNGVPWLCSYPLGHRPGFVCSGPLAPSKQSRLHCCVPWVYHHLARLLPLRPALHSTQLLGLTTAQLAWRGTHQQRSRALLRTAALDVCAGRTSRTCRNTGSRLWA